MSYNPELRVPFGYGTGHTTLGELRSWLLVHHHPEYVRRLLAWLSAQGGAIGVGGGWRAVQPNKDGFAPEGKSFHQDQHFSDGFVGAAAVDLVHRNGSQVHRAPYWSEVPAQGSAEAKRWGLHCNVSTEPWHMQPIEIDGWQSWKNAGSPAPKAGYPLPTDPPPNPPEDDDVYIDQKVWDSIQSAPPLADIQSGKYTEWFALSVIKGMYKSVTGTSKLTQAALEKLNTFLK